MWAMAINQTRTEDWVYLSEGGSTIVFSYTGPPNPVFTGKVLRLRKTPHPDRDDLDPAIPEFQNTVIAALVPSRFLPQLDFVLLDAPWLAALEALHNSDRPAERRAKDQIDKSWQMGILATDLVGGTDVMAIEIKPKWGFLPNPAHLSRETAGVKLSTCRFCMHTRFKSRDGDIPTQYCPLDLYSNDELRMKRAIRHLWDGWIQSNGTLNNMKIFLSGKMIIPSESYDSIGEFLGVSADVHDAFTTALLPLIRASPLGIISSLQRSLDALDIEGIVKLHATACPDGKDLGTSRGNPSLSELRDFTASYHSIYCALDHSRPCPENIDTYLVAYLLSATFKDCSMIFRIRRSGLSRDQSTDSSHAVSIIDLDLKGMDRFERWAELDRRIADYYRELAQRKSCVE